MAQQWIISTRLGFVRELQGMGLGTPIEVMTFPLTAAERDALRFRTRALAMATITRCRLDTLLDASPQRLSREA